VQDWQKIIHFLAPGLWAEITSELGSDKRQTLQDRQQEKDLLPAAVAIHQIRSALLPSTQRPVTI